jgi:hypothetical protein
MKQKIMPDNENIIKAAIALAETWQKRASFAVASRCRLREDRGLKSDGRTNG